MLNDVEMGWEGWSFDASLSTAASGISTTDGRMIDANAGGS
jgi:hypothetical protein